MKLTQIELRTKFAHIYEKKFNTESWCISELYWSFLKDYNTNKTKKCVIRLNDEWDIDINKITNQADVIQININFDFKIYFGLSKINRKRMQLDNLHNGMMRIAKVENWETPPLLDAYNYCMEKKLKYDFFISHKSKTSPNRKYSINFFCEWDIDLCKLYYVLYNKGKEEKVRDLLVEKESFYGEFVYYIKYKWKNNKKVVIENNHRAKEVFKVDLTNYLKKDILS